MNNILEKVDRVLQSIDYYEREKAFNQTKIESCDADLAILAKKKDIILAAKEYHKRAIDILYQSSIKDLEELLNTAISAIFYDRDREIRLELSDSRSKSLLWHIIDHDKGIEVSVKHGSGRGVRVVLSFILQSYYLLSFGSKFLFIDEGYSFISEDYVAKFFEFVKVLCKEKGLSLVMISHDNRFNGYEDKHYHIVSGTIVNED